MYKSLYFGVLLTSLTATIDVLPVAANAQGMASQNLAYIQTNELQVAGLTGKGIKIGVISNGVQNLSTAESAGAVPADVGVVNNAPGFGDEGDWMMSEIHEIAPDAQLDFCSPEQSTGRIKVSDCAKDLVGQYGVSIVVDDVSIDSDFAPTSNSVNYAHLLSDNPDLLALSAAGNSAQSYFQSEFSQNPIPLTLGGVSVQAQDFGTSVGVASTPYETITLQPGQDLDPGMVWSDNPSEPPPAANDEVGLWILDQGNNVLASRTATDSSHGLGLPYTNPSTSDPETVRVVMGVVQRDNSAPLFMALDSASESRSAPKFSIITPGGAEPAYSTVPGIVIVGASVVASNVMDKFSQSGPDIIQWSATQTGTDASGDPVLNYSLLSSIQGTDGVTLTGEEGWPIPDYPGNTTTDFSGTSAAAPSVAGVAALLMQAGLTRDQVVKALEQTAKPLKTDQYGNAITQAQGAQNQFDGYGLIQGYAALMSAGVSLPTPTITSPTSTTSISSGGSVSFAGSCAPPSGDTVSGYTWTFAGTDSQTGQPLTMQLLHAQNPGNVTFDQNGTWTVTFDCTDSAGLADGTPPTVTVNVGASGHPIPPTGPGAPLSGGGSHGGGGAFSLIGLLGLLCLLVIAKRGTIGRRTDVTGARWRFQESDGIFSPLDRS